MPITLHIDFSNGVTKTFAQVPTGLHNSVTQTLDTAALMQPGLQYEFDAEFVDRGGREVGAVTAIDGVKADEGLTWGVCVNNRAVSDLRRVTDFSVTTIAIDDRTLTINVAPGKFWANPDYPSDPTSSAGQLGGGTTNLETHLGPYKSNTTTDNRGPRLVKVLVERYM